MEPWAEQQLTSPIPAEEAKQSGLALRCLEAVRTGTRQYAKRQETYIRMTLAKSLKQAGCLERLMLLDGTNLSRFHTDLVPEAERLVDDFLEGKPLPGPSSLSPLARETFAKMNWAGPDVWSGKHFCEVCDRLLVGDKAWQVHISSNGHKKVLQGRRKHQQKLEYLQRNSRSAEEADDTSPLVEVTS
jgi:tRNA dimethylallyltransferase